MRSGKAGISAVFPSEGDFLHGTLSPDPERKHIFTAKRCRPLTAQSIRIRQNCSTGWLVWWGVVGRAGGGGGLQ